MGQSVWNKSAAKRVSVVSKISAVKKRLTLSNVGYTIYSTLDNKLEAEG